MLEYLLMVFFVCVSLSVTQYFFENEHHAKHRRPKLKWYRFWEYSRINVGLSGVGSVFLSTLTAYGCCTWLGVITSDESDLWIKSKVITSLPFNALEMVLPFILMAIGGNAHPF
jgi:hypothetical protein